MNLSEMTNPAFAALLVGYAVGRPDFVPLADEAYRRLCDGAVRSRAARRAFIPTPACVQTHTLSVVESAPSEGDIGGGSSDSRQRLWPENKENAPSGSASLSVSAANTQSTSERTHTTTHKKKRTKDNATLPPGFRRFWSEYPVARRRVHPDRCLAYWTEYGLEAMADTVIEAAKKLAEDDDWTREGGRWCPLTTTFLNQKRYEGITSPSTASAIVPKAAQPSNVPDFLRMAEQAAAQPRDPRRMNL